MKKIFLTGGTGFVGSNIAYQLLKLGHEVIFLIREVAGITAEQRLNSTLKVIDSDFELDKCSYQIVRGDICLPNLGICADELNSLKADKPDSIFHCAGSIAFSLKEYDKTWDTNVEGTRRILDFAGQVGASHLHHISTAYVVGDSNGEAQAGIAKATNQHYNNVYEMTKAIGEILIAENKFGINYTIYRPGIVIGAQNGQALNFDGYYTYQRSFWVLKELIQNRFNKNPELYRDIGIQCDGKLVLPVYIKCNFDANLNLVPIDWLAKMIVLLSEKSYNINQAFHLTHPEAPYISWVILTSLEIMGISGVHLINRGENIADQHERLKAIQAHVDKGIIDYIPYTNQNHSFDDLKTRTVLNSSYQPPPRIDRQFLERILNYAIKHNFKR